MPVAIFYIRNWETWSSIATSIRELNFLATVHQEKKFSSKSWQSLSRLRNYLLLWGLKVPCRVHSIVFFCHDQPIHYTICPQTHSPTKIKNQYTACPQSLFGVLKNCGAQTNWASHMRYAADYSETVEGFFDADRWNKRLSLRFSVSCLWNGNFFQEQTFYMNTCL
jgi:hypothetical protein